MQKKIGLIIVGVSVLLTFIVMVIVFNRQKDDSNYHKSQPKPEPKEFTKMMEEDEKMQSEREAFFNLMHRSAPGTNWKKMDADLRYNKMKERAGYYNLKITDDSWDTLANGNVVGKWNELGSFNTSGRIWATEVDFENDIVYAFTDGGSLWKGDLDGSNWSVINDNFKISATNMLKKVDDRLIVSTSQWGVQGVFYTEDEGISWTETTGLENVVSWGFIGDAEMLNDADHTIYILALEWDYVNWWDLITIYRSTDLGTSFEKIISYDVPTYGSMNNFVLYASQNGDGTCYLIENNNFYTLGTDGIPILTGNIPITDDGDIMLCGFEGITENHFYAAHANYASGETDFYTSDDNGVTWALTSSGVVEEGNFSKNSFYCSQKMEGYLYYGGVDSYRSFTGGSTWVRNNYWYEYYNGNELENLHADIPFIRSFMDTLSGEELIMVSTDGGLYKSENSGLTWLNITYEGMRNAQYYDVYTYRDLTDIIYAGAQDQGWQRSVYDVDGDYYFDQLISGDYGHIVSRSGGGNLWCVYPGFAMYIDDASTGDNMFFWDFQGYGHLWMAPVMQDPWDDEVAWWAGGSDAGGAYLWRLERSFGTINAVKQTKNFSVAGGGSISAINYSPIDKNYWYLLTSGGTFYTSTDAGETWSLSSGFTGPGPQYFYGAAIEPSKTQLGVVYIGGSGYDNPAVYKTEDNGETFVALNNELPSTLVYDLAISENDSLLFAATEIAPYVYVLAEDKWYDLSGLDAPLQTYWSVDYIEEIKAVRFGTYGRGAWEFKLYEQPVGIEELAQKNIITVYPNPASDIVHIKINSFIPDAKVELLDINGSVVLQKATAFNKDVAYDLNLNGIAKGVYFINITDNGANKKRYVERIVVID